MRSNARLTRCALLCVPIVAALCSTVPRPAAAAQAGPTFAKEVAPIIWSRCASCHRPGQVAPFSLLTYDDVKRRSGLIATVTAKRLMPPWKPQPGQGDFAG